jgi:hypothetical protein
MTLTSPVYGRASVDAIWKTAICDREVLSGNRAPPTYKDYFFAYMEDVRLQYIPEQAVKRMMELARMARFRQLSNGERLEDSLRRNRSSTLNLLRQILQSGLTWLNEEPIAQAIRAEVEKVQRESALFQRAVRRFCFQSRVARTDNGQVGVVPHRAEVKDVVAIIKGVCIPMVLRKIEGSDNQYLVIGQAYFYGFMYGEVFKFDAFREQTITLV